MQKRGRNKLLDPHKHQIILKNALLFATTRKRVKRKFGGRVQGITISSKNRFTDRTRVSVPNIFANVRFSSQKSIRLIRNYPIKSAECLPRVSAALFGAAGR